MTRKIQQNELDGLYRELYPSLVRFSQGIVGSRSDAEDAVHDAFVAAARSGPLEDARPWLYRVTRNASIDLLRRRRPTVAVDAVAAPDSSSAAQPHAAAVMGERLELIRETLAEMPEKRRTALLLRELAGLPYNEIGRVLDTSEANVKVLIFRARSSLHDATDAAELECTSVRVALSAAADRESGRIDRASARLHAMHCRGCREFRNAVSSQHAAIAILVPAVAVPHALATTGGGVMAGLGGAKASIGTLLAAATLTAGAGTVVVWSGDAARDSPRAAALSRPQPPAPARHDDRSAATERASEGDGETEAPDTGARAVDAVATTTSEGGDSGAERSDTTPAGGGGQEREDTTTTMTTAIVATPAPAPAATRSAASGGQGGDASDDPASGATDN